MIVLAIIAIVVFFFIIMGSSSSTEETQPASNVDRSAGTTEETAQPLGEILPLICPYQRLDEDIKYNLEQNPDAKFVYNYRTVEFPMLTYPAVVSTSPGDDGECMCDYMLISPTGNRFMIFYNIYEFMDVEYFLSQIRVKENGVYEYKQTAEVKQRCPTFCKLYNNARKVDKELVYDLPFLTTMDAERKVLLLAVWLQDSSLEKQGDLDKYHIALWKILAQMLEEMQKSGMLNQTKKALVKNFFRMGLMINRLS